jgi:hypothetical protein
MELLLSLNKPFGSQPSIKQDQVTVRGRHGGGFFVRCAMTLVYFAKDWDRGLLLYRTFVTGRNTHMIQD